LDVHRSQITFDWLDAATGECARGRITPADRGEVRRWLEQFAGREARFALEATTGWRYVVEEIQRAGLGAHLAEPAETAAMRGPKRRAKTDRADAKLMRELLEAGRLPESWIPPAHVLEMRATVRVYKALTDQRRGWSQRIHATLFHQGVPVIPNLSTRAGQAAVGAAEVSETGRQCLEVARRMIEAIDAQRKPLLREITWYARHQTGCKILMSFHGIGPIFAAAILCELGDVGRFARSRQVVRHIGIDVTVHSSDAKRSPGHLSRQGPEILRWAFYEAAQQASRATSPFHEDYLLLKGRLGHGRATLSIARRLAREVYHALRPHAALAIAPPVDPRAQPLTDVA
jgi:transposase